MRIYTSTQARAKISEVLDAATHGEPVEITRRDGSAAVVISKAEFEAYQNAKLDAEFDVVLLMSLSSPPPTGSRSLVDTFLTIGINAQRSLLP